ncbi:pseudouridine synthase [Roseisolibacter agri]|uniref:Pseudouridine synthase n=1 Tax=Roseisolibacter agri TaxID=2014610 RepID=A0AA37V993_9BACT|nr:pseudouridine synthase [Roseisolibacter agri]GLC24193.1 pseudouridine synthase [Roseisolibacter agri]
MRSRPDAAGPRDAVSLARALSKLGVCSRRDAEAWVRAGRVRVGGRVVREPSHRVDPGRDAIAVDGDPVRAAARVYLAMNKPRGVVVSREDARGAPTVHDLLATHPVASRVAHLSPVGRLDKASEGLLLVTNDTRWGARLLDPASHVDRTYHVQIDRVPDDALLDALRAGVATQEGDTLAAKAVRVLRSGDRTAWLEVVLDEGRNRHIRRMLAARDVETLRLVRVAIGPLALGDLPKGAVRALTAAEQRALTTAG